MGSIAALVPLRLSQIDGHNATMQLAEALKNRPFPEWEQLHRLMDAGREHVQVQSWGQAQAGGQSFPLYSLALGNPAPTAPAIGFFGGVHGLERIGAEVVLAFLRHVLQRLKWDATLHRHLEDMRWVFMPVVNPGGMWLRQRSNPNGVDLMRNSPTDAGRRALFLVGGQRMSAKLPWYRGAVAHDPVGDDDVESRMETEARALCALVRAELLGRPFSLALDCHSGFGLRDRLWFPYAHTRRPIAHLAELHAMKSVFEQSPIQHRYIMEPQSQHYLAHGDLWDYLYAQSLPAAGTGPESDAGVFLPLTLEMGSWNWVKKNPRQLLWRHGLFNPVKERRQRRVLRRHLGLLDFLARAVVSHQRWLPLGADRNLHEQQALDRWYRRTGLERSP
jgi:hypothetical protein